MLIVEQGIIDFKGSTMVDCPERLHSGADLLISLSVYILPSAFKRPSTNSESFSNPLQQNSMFNEGQETEDEQMLRERKSSLLKMFHTLGLKPRSGNRSTSGNEAVPPEPLPRTPAASEAMKSKVPINTETVGEGEEVPVEDDNEELSENELNVIYKR